MRPYIKFNGGYGVILCKGCSRTLKEGLTDEEWDGITDLFYCNKCKTKRNEKQRKDTNIPTLP